MEPIPEAVLTSLRQITRAISLHSRHIQQAFGLTGPQLMLMRELARQGELSAGGLAAALNLSHATVTGIMDRLEARGLLDRTRSPADRRRVLVRLTAAGRELLGEAPEPLQNRFLAEFGRLEPWEQSQILASLQRVASMMLAERLEAAPVLMDGGGETSGSAVEAFFDRLGEDPDGESAPVTRPRHDVA